LRLGKNDFFRKTLQFLRDFPPADDKGYVVAYGDGTPEDRDALRRINFEFKTIRKIIMEKK